MPTMSVEAEFKLRNLHLANRPLGGLFLDHLLRFTLEPRDTSIEATRVVEFDGLSLNEYNLPEDFKDAMAVMNSGPARRDSSGHLGELAEESLEALSRAQGVPLGSIRKIGRLLLKRAGLTQHDEGTSGRSPLVLAGKKIGTLKHQVRTYNTLRRPLKSIRGAVPESQIGHLSGQPVLVSKTSVNMDLSRVPTEKNGLVRVKMRDNYHIDKLLPSHYGNVVVTAWHAVRVESSEEGAAQSRLYAGKEEQNLGLIEYKIIHTSRKKREEEDIDVR